jgi:AcrR family transcriptional regulator
VPLSPRVPEENARIREATRARLVEAALGLFARHGYAGTTVRMIARAAGVSTGLLYAYFESKEGLLRAIFEESMAEVRASFAEAEADGPPAQRIERLVRASFRIVRSREAFWRLSYGVRMQAAVLEELDEQTGAWTGEIGRVLLGYLEEAGVAAPEIEARILFALIDGVSQHYVLNPESYPLDAVIERIVARYR